ncbi:hypothetical protein BT63DRAFT_430657 [Microthyrium microscopicum]|uniref:holo-[acyl-carrier-protein] synthase n=1 Tax=Microthyrium microscopicum TaxID=703497 RepID=A0A6A6TV99_9PEZI|nr:hypothetical protein BT63DRAFT_430657 [Microthyrium microscopicum]
MASHPKTEITRWLLDTRTLWSGTKIQDAARDHLALLPPAEQNPILSKYRFPDACMSLGSALLKRAFLAKATGLPWSSIAFSRRLDPRLGKPCWASPPGAPPNDEWPHIDFNVSHQKGLVVLVGAVGRGAPVPDVSVDLTSPNERNDMASIAGSDVPTFLAVFSDVFSEQELFALAWSLPPQGSVRLLDGEEVSNVILGRLDRTVKCGQALSVMFDGRQVKFESELLVEEKVRNFYAAFALKEAYVKLAGEGLAARWIQEIEFTGVRAPRKGAVPRCSLAGVFGETIGNKDEEVSITFKGEEVRDVLFELQSFEEDYIIASMIKPLEQDQEFPDWHRISLDRDIMPLATKWS